MFKPLSQAKIIEAHCFLYGNQEISFYLVGPHHTTTRQVALKKTERLSAFSIFLLQIKQVISL